MSTLRPVLVVAAVAAVVSVCAVVVTPLGALGAWWFAFGFCTFSVFPRVAQGIPFGALGF